MYLAHLALNNFRTFRRLELDLQPGLHLIVGGNARGKTNLLEAVALLATTRSSRGGSDADLISWNAVAEEPLPAARVLGQVEGAGGRTTVEVAVIARASTAGAPFVASRRFRVNGVARRASDLIGRLRVVMFGADDLQIVDGPPAGRRRYLDITISQFDPAYVRALQRYSRVLLQRNSLLRRLQERRGLPDELDFWDDELAAAGAVVVDGRRRSLVALGQGAAGRYEELSPAGARLEVCYRPALPVPLVATLDQGGLEERLREALKEHRRADIQAGVTRIGPHRDDIAFLLGGHDAGAFGSRGEQRTVALALRLAEVELSTRRTGEPPVLLLDDILSELDRERRERVLAAAYGVDQAIITTADPDRPSVADLPEARRYRLDDGRLTPEASSATSP